MPIRCGGRCGKMQGKKWSTPERDERVIELYAQYESAIKVAEVVGCGRTTVNNILVKYGIPRIGRSHGNGKKRKPKPEPKVKKSHCRSKYCPALIVMLYRCMGYKARDIAEATGYKMNGVQNVLSKRGLANTKSRLRKSDFDLDQIEYELLVLKIPGRQLDKKYGLSEGTVSKWMRQRGHYSGKGAHQEGRAGRSRSAGDFVYSDKMKELNQQAHEEATLRFAEKLQERFCGRFVVAGEYRPDGKLLATVRCTECGHVFTHSIDMRKDWHCPSYKETNRERRNLVVSIERFARFKSQTHESVEKAISAYELAADSLRIYLVDKRCVICGATFHSDNPRQICCSSECSKMNIRKYGRGDIHRRRARRYHVAFDKSITLVTLYRRDKGVCQICGKPCDWNDDSYGSCGPTYPSIDHIKPFARGGGHTWNNVQLAHFMCNSIKGSTYGEVTDDVKLAC